MLTSRLSFSKATIYTLDHKQYSLHYIHCNEVNFSNELLDSIEKLKLNALNNEKQYCFITNSNSLESLFIEDDKMKKVSEFDNYALLSILEQYLGNLFETNLTGSEIFYTSNSHNDFLFSMYTKGVDFLRSLETFIDFNVTPEGGRLDVFQTIHILDEPYEIMFTSKNKIKFKKGFKISTFTSFDFFKRKILKELKEALDLVFYELAPPILKLQKKVVGCEDNIYLYLLEDLSRHIFNVAHCNLEVYMKFIQSLNLENPDFFTFGDYKISISELKQTTGFNLLY